MPIKIVRNDITKIECDAIVNAAKNSLLGGGGVDGAIHKAAGKGLLEECMKLGGCKTGQAKITCAYKLPCKYVIHTVGPVWRGGDKGEKELLESCYRQSLKLAKDNNCQSVAFPLISSGAYGYPKAEALRVAMDIISEFLLDNEMLVYVVIFDKNAYQISEKLFTDIKSYIDDNYVDFHSDTVRERRQRIKSYEEPVTVCSSDFNNECLMMSECAGAPAAFFKTGSLEDELKRIDESFSQMLLRKIDEKGIKDSVCYKKANVDRKLFSKIRNDVNYRPSKTTALAFAIALELNLEDTKDMLMKAGYALSRSNKADIIIEYFIKNKNYNIMEINEALFAFDQSLLGV